MPSGALLLELRIKDFALIDELGLSLEPGLNALTGETGAGKSILIDALGAVLGGRAGPAVVRAGAQRAVIEATFTRPPALPAGIELEDADDVLILSREIGANGRGAARLNGRSVPLSLLQTAGRALVDVHGQSDHQSLLRPATHVLLLDRFAGLDRQREEVADLARRLRQVEDEVARLRSGERELARRQDLLRFQVEEIDAARLISGEDEELAGRRSVLANAERLRETAAAALASLGEEAGAVDRALEAAKHTRDAARLDPSLAEAAAQLEGAASQLQDVVRSLSRYLDAIEADPDELQRVDDRLDLIRSLKRKYGDTLDEVLAFAERARAELEGILGSGGRLRQLEEQAAHVREQGLDRARDLSRARQQAGRQLAEQVEAELAALNMSGARFAVSIVPRADAPATSGASPSPALHPTGIDEVEFLLSANRGEPLRPLAQVASGGETSRLMLALKSALSAADETPVLVFDEIEAGVGARGGHVIGHKLRCLAEHHQVLCITHLAPVAAAAGAHFRVRKIESGQRTATAVERIEGDERVNELAEMLAGRPVSEAARHSARELLGGA